jgi:hypothetical protein
MAVRTLVLSVPVVQLAMLGATSYMAATAAVQLAGVGVGVGEGSGVALGVGSADGVGVPEEGTETGLALPLASSPPQATSSRDSVLTASKERAPRGRKKERVVIVSWCPSTLTGRA